MKEKIPHLVLGLVFGLVAQLAFGQTNVVPPTPNASKMTEYFSQRPNMYTGTANVSLPLFDIDFDGWQLPFSLSYNATGIRVGDEAGEVGLGWSLHATGVISRAIRGGDDLFPGNSLGQTIGYVYSQWPVSYNLGFDDSGANANCPDPSTYYAYLASGAKDTEPDILNYNFFGYSGSFVLSQKVADSVNHKVNVIKITQDACSILFDEPSMTFSVITPDGYRGDFTVKERSTTFSSSLSTDNHVLVFGQNNIDMTWMLNSSARFRTTTSWYLSKITSPRGRVISFYYDLATVPSSGFGTTYNAGDTYSPYLSNTRSYSELDYENPMSVVNGTQVVHEHVYLKSIFYSNSNYDSVRFSMETREDLRKNYLYEPDSNTWNEFPSSKNLKRYTGISVKGISPSTLNKQITFTQNYFNQGLQDAYANNQNEKELRFLRGRLDRLLIDDNEYQFYYDNGQAGLPNKLTMGMDHFGFYNGQDANLIMLPCWPNSTSVSSGDWGYLMTLQQTYYQQPARVSNFNYGRAGLLTKVKYPTRGYTVFTYEPHTYSVNSYNTYFVESGSNAGTAGGARIKTINEYDYNDNLLLSKSYSYNTGMLASPLLYRFWKNDGGSGPPVYDFKYRAFARIPGNNADSKVIGYGKVDEVVNGSTDSYRNSYYFENAGMIEQEPGSINLSFTSFANRNGQAKEVRNYDSHGNLLHWVQNIGYNHVIDSVKGIMHEPPPPGPIAGGGASCFIGWRTFYAIKRSFYTPYTVITTVANQTGGLTENSDGTVTINSGVQTQKKVSYNGNYLLKYERLMNAAGDSIVTLHNRPADYDTTSSAISPAVKYMRRAKVNIVNPVIETIAMKNGNVIAATASNYLLQSGIVNLGSTYAFNRNVPGTFQASVTGTFPAPATSPQYELVTNFSQYDATTGELQEYTGADGVTNSFIWGYNGLLPVAHGVGVGYSNLNTAYNAALVAGSPGSTAFETALRGNSGVTGKQVTTFTHNPGIGVTAVMDPAVQKSTFQYDKYGRLITTLDNAGKIKNQYKYHLMTRAATRVLALSTTSINFGTLTPEMWATQTVPYARCSDAMRSQVFTLTNNGDDDLVVYGVVLPPGFISSWYQGTITPGTSVNAIISFDNTKSLGTYSGTITINSNATSGGNTATVTATYASKTTNIGLPQPPPPTVNFGTISGNNAQATVTITNTGNYPLRLTGVSLDGDTSPRAIATNGTFTVNSSSQCIGGSLSSQLTSVGLQASFTPQVNGNMSSNLSLYFDDGTTFSQAIILTGIKGTPTVSVSAPPHDFGSFTTSPVTQQLTISNVGASTIAVSSITGTNTRFAVSPQSLSILPGKSQSVNVTYTAADFTQQSTTLTINSNDPAGASQSTVTAQESQLYQLSGAPASVSIKPSQQTQSTYLTNTGNVPVTISSVPPSPPSGFAVTYLVFSGGIWVPVNPNSSAVVLQPGAQLQISVTIASGGNFNSASGTVALFDSLNNAYYITVTKSSSL
ncbi:MAG TPA: DUF1573 domain-containing protein [Cyclobacteriaceae bacterium]|nr:DUF1573 domain-containing protein [Cyclobacteriaceae bacterium]